MCVELSVRHAGHPWDFLVETAVGSGPQMTDSGGRSVQQGHLATQRLAENTGSNSPRGMERGNLGKKPRKYTLAEVFGLVFILFLSLKTADLNTWSGDPEVSFEGL